MVAQQGELLSQSNENNLAREHGAALRYAFATLRISRESSTAWRARERTRGGSEKGGGGSKEDGAAVLYSKREFKAGELGEKKTR